MMRPGPSWSRMPKRELGGSLITETESVREAVLSVELGVDISRNELQHEEWRGGNVAGSTLSDSKSEINSPK